MTQITELDDYTVYVLRASILDANGVLGRSYYANSLKEYAGFRALNSWTQDMDLLNRHVGTVFERVTDKTGQRAGEYYDTSRLEHKMHLVVGFAAIDRDGELVAAQVLPREKAKGPLAFEGLNPEELAALFDIEPDVRW